MKRVLVFCMGLLALGMASLAISGTASAGTVPDDCPNKNTAPPNNFGPNCEEAETTFSLAARKGSLYQGGTVAADWKINVQVNAPYVAPDPGDPQPDVLPLKRVNLKVPTDMTFNPNNAKTPVCTDGMFGPDTNVNQKPIDIINLCPKSVIGNGTADLFISHKNTPTGPNIKDPTLIVFNAGRVAGQPKIKIHGYSKATSAGIYMEGVLEADGTLEMAVPPLSNDSAVSRFDLRIPGTEPIKYNNVTLPESAGQDPNYLQAKCSTGSWLLTSEFILGTRDDAGNPTSPDAVLDAPDVTVPCVGKPGKPSAGKPRIGKVVVKGPAKVKRGKKATYKVTIRNTGKSTARGIRVVAKGKGAKGSAKGPNIPAGKSRTVKVKVKFTRKGKSKVTFTARSRNAGSKKAAKVVRVR